MLKTITLTLVAVGLLRGAKAVEASQQDTSNIADSSNSVPGFKYVRRIIPRMNINAPGGVFNNYQGIRNSSAWRPKFGNGFAEITQSVTLPSTFVRYPDTSATLGILRKVGPVVANLDKSTYKLALIATGNSTASGNSTSCELNFQLEVSCLEMDLSLRGLGLIGMIIRLTIGAYNEIKESVATSLTESLPDLLTGLVEQDATNKVDLDALCKQMLASNTTTFPEPLF